MVLGNCRVPNELEVRHHSKDAMNEQSTSNSGAVEGTVSRGTSSRTLSPLKNEFARAFAFRSHRRYPKALTSLRGALRPLEYLILEYVFEQLDDRRVNAIELTTGQLARALCCGRSTVARALKALTSDRMNGRLAFLLSSESDRKINGLRAYQLDWHSILLRSRFDSGYCSDCANIWMPADWFRRISWKDGQLILYLPDGRELRPNRKGDMAAALRHMVKMHGGLEMDGETLFKATQAVVKKAGFVYIGDMTLARLAVYLRALRVPREVKAAWYLKTMVHITMRSMNGDPIEDLKLTYPFRLVGTEWAQAWAQNLAEQALWGRVSTGVERGMSKSSGSGQAKKPVGDHDGTRR